MFSMCSELTPRARIPDTRIPQLMQPCLCLCLFALIFERINITVGCHGHSSHRNYRMNTGLDAVGPDPQPNGQDPGPGEDPGQQEGGAQEDRGPPADRDDQQVAKEHMHK